MHVALAPQMSKEEREAAINQKIEEMRRKNASITQRYQEIENDKKNAENFSLEATQRTKTRVTPANEEKNSSTATETSQKETNANARAAKESRRIKPVTLPSVPVTTDFRPQRLSENDLPPPDPVFSYLTDRLREGAFCSPISPAARRKHSTSSQGSEMSIGSSNNSRRTSTTSNSSWTSDTSSKYCGFANYQPPRKYSACRDYVRNRRMSEQMISSETRENDIWPNQGNNQRNCYKDAKKPSENNTTRNRQPEKPATVASDANESETSITSPVTRRSGRPALRRESSVPSSRSENITNWRDRRISYNSTEELGFTSLEEGVARLTVANEDMNNNSDMINHNLPMPEAAFD
ncbi:uncharacterized protein LOC130692900 [Daphnia carinata]|uniref:uncharacterized protein LOC130692900 n=1 Tax=Daphnia carinata TaxID=120202 RepID=UPI00257E26C9|nr:uncharacterized protein LOC130692900 [Daphnia carinata]